MARKERGGFLNGSIPRNCEKCKRRYTPHDVQRIDKLCPQCRKEAKKK